MKTLLGIIAVVALLALPAMAANVPVQITVTPYVGFVTAPGSLVMTASDIWHPGVALGEGVHQATTPFKVIGNVGITATLTAQYTSNSAGDVPGGTQPTYPTAYIGGTNADLTKGIGFGPCMSDLTHPSNLETGWNGIALKDTIAFPMGQTDGQIKINTYIDSGRTGVAGGTGQLAGPGVYTCDLYLTLSVTP